MSREIRAEVVLESSSNLVWAVLTNFSEHADWNPFFISVAGQEELGAFVGVDIEVPEASGLKYQGRIFTSDQKFRPRTFMVDPGKRLAWRSGMFLPGLFDREVSFEIEELEDGRVRFVHRARLSGLLVPFRQKTIQDLESGYRAMNEALANRMDGLGVVYQPDSEAPPPP